MVPRSSVDSQAKNFYTRRIFFGVFPFLSPTFSIGAVRVLAATYRDSRSDGLVENPQCLVGKPARNPIGNVDDSRLPLFDAWSMHHLCMISSLSTVKVGKMVPCGHGREGSHCGVFAHAVGCED
jgi:hypothetical protein